MLQQPGVQTGLQHFPGIFRPIEANDQIKRQRQAERLVVDEIAHLRQYGKVAVALRHLAVGVLAVARCAYLQENFSHRFALPGSAPGDHFGHGILQDAVVYLNHRLMRIEAQHARQRIGAFARQQRAHLAALPAVT